MGTGEGAGRTGSWIRHPVILSERGWAGGSGVEAKDLAALIQNTASNDSDLPNKLETSLALGILGRCRP